MNHRTAVAYRLEGEREPPMSALGQKQTYAVQNGMSALPPKADMCGATRDVRFGPIADTCIAANCALFDHGICLHENSGRNRETQNFGALDVDNEL